jgi:hypothetical protein
MEDIAGMKVSVLGQRVAKVLEAKGIKDIASFEDSCGFDKDYVRHLIKGYKSGLDFVKGVKLAVDLGVDPVELALGKKQD